MVKVCKHLKGFVQTLHSDIVQLSQTEAVLGYLCIMATKIRSCCTQQWCSPKCKADSVQWNVYVSTIPLVGRSTFHITEESFTQKGWKSRLKSRQAGKRGKARQAGQFISNVRISLTVGDKVSEGNCLQYVLDKLPFNRPCRTLCHRWN